MMTGFVQPQAKQVVLPVDTDLRKRKMPGDMPRAFSYPENKKKAYELPGFPERALS